MSRARPAVPPHKSGYCRSQSRTIGARAQVRLIIAPANMRMGQILGLGRPATRSPWLTSKLILCMAAPGSTPSAILPFSRESANPSLLPCLKIRCLHGTKRRGGARQGQRSRVFPFRNGFVAVSLGVPPHNSMDLRPANPHAAKRHDPGSRRLEPSNTGKYQHAHPVTDCPGGILVCHQPVRRRSLFTRTGAPWRPAKRPACKRPTWPMVLSGGCWGAPP